MSAANRIPRNLAWKAMQEAADLLEVALAERLDERVRAGLVDEALALLRDALAHRPVPAKLRPRDIP